MMQGLRRQFQLYRDLKAARRSKAVVIAGDAVDRTQAGFFESNDVTRE